MAKKERFQRSVNIKNRKARFEYEVLDTYVAGMALLGTEIKSIREGKASLQEAYCGFKRGELFIWGMNISPYAEARHFNHELTRPRKLLLKRNELRRLSGKTEEKGLSIVPLRLFINDRGWAKLEIGLGRGKKVHDKRENIKARETKRELQRMKLP